MSESTRLKNEALERARLIAADLRAANDQRQTPELQQAFDEAQRAQQPLEEPSTGPPPRTTSFAKSLDGPDNRATHEPQQERQGRGSDMVEKDRAEPEPVNNSREAQAVKESQFNQAWAKEQTGAKEVNDRAAAIASELQQDRAQAHRSPGQDRGMG